MKRVLLIDGKNLVYRMHYSHLHLSSNGRPTSVLYAFPNAILEAEKLFGASDLVVMWDNGLPLAKRVSGPPVEIWRKALARGVYKANREPNPESEKALSQIPELSRFLDLCKILQLGVPSLEADDLMGLAVGALLKDPSVKQIYILSNDRDHYQLVQDRVMILYPGRQGMKVLDEEAILRETGVWPHEWSRYKALAGDASDSYKPIKGIGPKTALMYIRNGVDPAKASFEKLSPAAQTRWAHLKPYWNAIHRCYILSKIPTKPDFRWFPDIARPGVQQAVSDLISKRERKMSQKELDLRLSKLIGFFHDFEMDQLKARRKLFFKSAVILD